MYQISINGHWTPIEESAALERLGQQYASFSDLETAFITLPQLGLRESRFCMFSMHNVHLFALESVIIKHTYDEPRFRYLIKPSDFLEPHQSLEIERVLGNLDSLMIGG